MAGIEEFERRMCVLLEVPQPTLAERIIRLKGHFFCQLPTPVEPPSILPSHSHGGRKGKRVGQRKRN